MKMLFITLLIFSCGKEKTKDKPKFFIPLERQKTFQDRDGDGMQDHLDDRPLIADLPELKFNLKIWDLNQAKKIEFHENRTLRNQIEHLISEKVRSETFHFDFKNFAFETSKIIPQFENDIVNLEISDLNYPRAQVNLKHQGQDLIAIQTDLDDSKMTRYSRELLQGKEFTPEIVDFSLGETSYYELFKTVQGKTYELTIWSLNGVRKHHIASGSSLKEALAEIDPAYISKIKDQRDLFQASDLHLIPDSTPLWFILNTKKQLLDSRPAPQEHIVLFETKLERIKKNSSMTDEHQYSAGFHDMKISLKDIIGFEIKPKLSIELPIQRTEYERCEWRIFGASRLKPHYAKYSLSYSHTENIESIFDIFINGNQIGIKELGQYKEYYAHKDAELLFKLKPNLAKNILQGIQINPPGGGPYHQVCTSPRAFQNYQPAKSSVIPPKISGLITIITKPAFH